MKTIKCRKCGSAVDASKGVCPVCGTMFYIIPENDERDLDSTRVWDTPPEKDAGPGFAEMDPDEMGATRRMPAQPQDGRNTQRPASGQQQRPDQRRASGQPQRPQQGPSGRQQRPQSPPGQRPVQQRPSGQQQRSPGRQPGQRQPIDPRQAYYEEGYRGREKGGPGIDKRALIVGAIALVAVVTVVICFLAGVFDFGDSDGVKMIDVRGMTSESAEIILTNLGITVKLKEADSDEPKGTVIDQSIAEGEEVKKNATVTLTISNGSGHDEEDEEDKDTEVPAPYLIGKTLTEARQAAEELGLSVVETGEQYSDTVPSGKIVSQTPNSGAYLKDGDIISVVISKGAEPTPTPTGYTITVTAGKGGSVSPKGQVSVQEGGTITFTITPDEGYELRELKIDGVDVGAQLSYTFTNVTAGHTLYAVFQVKTVPTPTPTPIPTPTPTPQQTPETEEGAITLP